MTYLGCSVARRAASSLESLILLVHVGETEIDDFEGVVVVQEQVLWLQVTMANTGLVEVLDARDQLPIEFGSLWLIQSSIPHNKVEQFASIGVLHYHE